MQTGKGKTILIGMFDNVLAHIARPLLVAKVLRDMDYRVIFAGGGSYFELIKNEGFETRPLLFVEPDRIIKSVRRFFIGVGLWDEGILDSFVQDELRLYSELQPDLVIHDTRPSIPISARVAGIPCVSITNAYLTWYGTTSWRFFHPFLNPFLEPIRRRIVIQPHNKIREKYNVPKTRVREMMYDGDLILLADVPEFAPTVNLPGKYKYVGPLPWEPDIPIPSELNEINPGKFVIYFTMGSTGLPHLFKEVIKQLGNTEYQVVITTGWQIDPAQLAPLPDNVIATTYLPGIEMMKRSDLVICQSGNGTTYQALYAGVPIIGVPTHGEQWQNAALIEAQGAGLAIKPEEINNIKPLIEKILNNGYYKENALRMKKILSNYNGPERAAWEIHDFLHRV
jgi:MGT family glycosyltransferase